MVPVTTTVEEYYKLLKEQLNGRFYQQSTLSGVKQQLLWQQTTSILHSILSKLVTDCKNKAVNIKAMLSFSSNILKHLAFPKVCSIKKLGKLLKLFSATILYTVRTSRSFERSAIIDNGQWYRGKGKEKEKRKRKVK